MNYKRNFIAVVIITSLFLGSCLDQYNICDQSKITDLQAGFYQRTGGVETVTAAPSFTLALLNSSSSTYNQQSGVSKFSLTLNQTVDSSKYFIKVSNSLPADTITFFYTTQNFTISPECGTVPVFNLSGVSSTLNTIDSVKIINPTINNTGTENLKIYF